jgi:uncharacterized protein YidB (DUF937 family)
MGLFDQLLQAAPGLAGQVARNPQLVSAAASLLSQRPGSIGGTGGLAGLVSAFEQKGLGNLVNAWVSTGPNPPVSAAQVQQVLGSDVVQQIATHAGLSPGDASSSLATLLPALIDHLTPNGQVPQAGALEGMLSSLLGGLGK